MMNDNANNVNNVIPFIPVSKNEDDTIIIKRGIRTMEAVKAVSDYIKDLPLTNEQNDKLINLLKDQLLVTEHEAFIQGFTLCMEAIQNGGLSKLGNKIVVAAESET